MTPPRKLEIDQPDYPDALRALPQPPPVLHVRGRLELLCRPGIAVIGTRAHSTYGRDSTVSFVVGLVRAGYVIVSGLARGIDSIAHRTALDMGGDTVAVLGTGIDVPYPPEHRELFHTIAQRGCLVTEFPPGTSPRKWHFPQRNRIIAALSRGVVVIEAPEKSGALITAHYALDEGKEVFAVPGPIHNRTGFWRHRSRTALQLSTGGTRGLEAAQGALDVDPPSGGWHVETADSESASALIPLPPDSRFSRCYEFYFLPPRHAPDLGGQLRGHIGGTPGRKANGGAGLGGTLDWLTRVPGPSGGGLSRVRGAGGRGIDAFLKLAILHEDRLTGMREGKRDFGLQIEVRCWESVDAREGTPTALPWETLHRLVAEVPGVVSVTYNLATKPPSTMEVV